VKDIVLRQLKNDGREEREAKLIERAQQGDHDAFSELVRRHRPKAHAWASGITQDPHMADDIVQDALIRAFMHLGTLVDAGRFLPWLHAIVRNQAMMKLRRGGPYGKERPFSSFEASSRPERVDWEDVESILTFMVRKQEQENGVQGNPEALLVQKETLETMLGLFSCLKRRERGIFEAYFFKHLSPQEIAAMFDTTTASVYKTISRTRQKLQHERIRVYINEHLNRRKEKKCMTKKLLERPSIYTQRVGDSHFLGARPSITYCMWGLMQYTDKKGISLDEVNGLTGHAFYLNIHETTVNISGPFEYAGEETFQKAMENLGYHLKIIPFTPLEPAVAADALETIHYSIDQGVPPIVWDLFHSEFGLVYGYDDDRQQMYALDKLRQETLAYDQLGKGDAKEIFVLAVKEANGIDRLTAVRTMLDMVLEHGRTTETKKHPNGGSSVKGIAAYETWVAAFEGGGIVPFFNAYNIAVYSELRKYAVQFLRRLEEEFKAHDWSCIGDAVLHYETLAEALQGLAKLFPFPQGGNPKDPENVSQAIQLLWKARQAEDNGLLALERLRDLLAGFQAEGVQ